MKLQPQVLILVLTVNIKISKNNLHSIACCTDEQQMHPACVAQVAARQLAAKSKPSCHTKNIEGLMKGKQNISGPQNLKTGQTFKNIHFIHFIHSTMAVKYVIVSIQEQ